MEKRVVITGIGPITAGGIGVNSFINCIFNKEAVINKIPEVFEKNYSFKSRFYVPAPDFSVTEFGLPKALEGAMERISKFSVAGTKLALEDAGLSVTKGDRYFTVENIGNCDIVIGVGMSSLQTALQSYVSHLFNGEKELFQEYNINPRFNRMVIPMLMPNSAAAWISIIFGIKGFSSTVNAACASGTVAIGEAFRRIKDGYCTTVITGGVECLAEEKGAIMRGFDMLSTLTKSEDGHPMPFSKKRSGFLFNEGAGCILVLEEMEAAKNRGADIYAEICGYESNSDAYNIVQMEDSGEAISSLLQKLIKGREIQYLNAHGTGTVLNDGIEAKVINKVFGDNQPYINSSKGILGHSIGASGALEAAITAFSIKNSKIHGNLLVDPMDNLNLAQESTKANIEFALSTSYGFGGHNSGLLFKRVDI